jgi:uncharacterized lipoprotein
MIKKIVLLLVILALASCSSSKPAIATTKKAAAVQTRTAATKRSTPVKPTVKNYPSANNTTEVIQSTSKTVVSSDLINNYVLQYKDIAMGNMKTYGIPASIILAHF